MNNNCTIFTLLLFLMCSRHVYALPSPIESFTFDTNLEFMTYGGSDTVTLVEGVKGKAININENCLKIPIKKLGERGSISFWMKPNWGYYEHEDSVLTSHTFLSMKWKNGGYLSFSDGWWENSGGALNTYFIFNNIDLLNVSSKIKYKKDTWSHLVVTWDSRLNEIRLFHNGKNSATKRKVFSVGESSGTLYLGCDKGTHSSKGRYLNGTIDLLEIYNVALSETEVIDRFKSANVKTNNISQLDLTNHQHDNNAYTNEIRAVFDSYPASWQTRAQAEATIKRLYESGFNVYIPCVWYGDGARYDSEIAPHAKHKGEGKPFEYLIKVAHKYGIEVHPWITVTFRSSRNSSEFLHEYYDKGTPPNAFEVHKKSFRDFIVTIAHELITNYDIDGLNLDFIRTMGVSKSHFVLSEFQKKYKKTLASQLKMLDSKQKWPMELQEFVNKPIDDIVERISQIRAESEPQLILSVDGHPEPLFMGESRQGRNELKWLNNGLIDIVFAMEYSMNIDYERIDLVKKDAIDPARVIVLMGAFNKTKPNTSRSAKQVEKLIHFSRSRWNNGIALYPYYYMTDALHALLGDGSFSVRSQPKWPR